jgi:hypothetical protein
MKSSVTATVNLYEEALPFQPCYTIHVKFDPYPDRNWTIEETEEFARIWAGKLFVIDRALNPGWLRELRWEVLSALANQILPRTRGHVMGAGMTVYIDAAPAGSRLRDRFQLQYRLQMLRNEVAAQVPLATT